MDSQLFQGLCCILELERQYHQIWLQSCTAFQIKLLCRTHIRQLQQFGCSQRIDGALVRFCFDSNQLVVQLQRNHQAGRNIIAADQLLWLLFDDHLSSCLIGNGDRIISGRLLCLSRCFLRCIRLGNCFFPFLLRLCAGCQRQRHTPCQQHCNPSFHIAPPVVIVLKTQRYCTKSTFQNQLKMIYYTCYSMRFFL